LTRQLGRYRIDGTLGEGATGTVYLGTHPDLGRSVAIKELAPNLVGDPAFLERFRIEAQTMARLDHPNCVKVYDFFETAEGAYLVSEYVHGASLRKVQEKAGRLTPEQSLGVLKGALSGLAYAHGLGLVHRDIKPENLLADAEGVSKLADFGLAVFHSGPGAAGGLMGTPAYISPEAATGGTVDQRADIYSAGCMLFEFLCGRIPFTASNALAMTRQHIADPVPDPRRVNPELPDGVALMVMKAMAKDPEDRQQSADLFLAELEAAAVEGYGEDWEDRSSIKEKVSLLLLLLLGAGAGAGVTAGAAVGAGESAGRHVPRLFIVGGLVGLFLLLLGGGVFTLEQGFFSGLFGAHGGGGSSGSTGSNPPPGVIQPHGGPPQIPNPVPGTSPNPTGSPPSHFHLPPPPINQPGPPGPPIIIPNPTGGPFGGGPPGGGGSVGAVINQTKVFFAVCESEFCPAPQDGSPYNSPKNRYPPTASPAVFCGRGGFESVRFYEQYNWSNPTGKSIAVTVSWAIHYPGRNVFPTFTSMNMPSHSKGTHNPNTSEPASHTPGGAVSGNGTASYVLSWTDPGGAHRQVSSPTFFWHCSPAGGSASHLRHAHHRTVHRHPTSKATFSLFGFPLWI
jgi:hypothetical protein